MPVEGPLFSLAPFQSWVEAGETPYVPYGRALRNIDVRYQAGSDDRSDPVHSAEPFANGLRCAICVERPLDLVFRRFPLGVQPVQGLVARRALVGALVEAADLVAGRLSIILKLVIRIDKIANLGAARRGRCLQHVTCGSDDGFEADWHVCSWLRSRAVVLSIYVAHSMAMVLSSRLARSTYLVLSIRLARSPTMVRSLMMARS